MGAALLVVRLLHAVDVMMGWKSHWQPSAAQAVLGTLASSMFAFIVFLSSTLLLAVGLAGGRFTPRAVAFVFEDPVTQFSLGVFMFTFTFTVASLVRVGDSVPFLTTIIAAYSCLASMVVFLYMLNHLGRSLRPSWALQTAARVGREVILRVYPRPEAEEGSLRPTSIVSEKPASIVASSRNGVLLAMDTQGVARWAQRHDCVMDMVPEIGDFVALGDPLFRIFHGGAALSTSALCQSVALGQNRRLDNDPASAFRIIVDIACRALSPGINDPTTAVLALDQLHHLLRTVGTRHLDEGRVCDAAGKIRLVYPMPGWEDFVHLAVTEIRHYGGNSIQVVRRMRAMLEELIRTLPEERAPSLLQQLEMLNSAAERFFLEPGDRALSGVGDVQGMGGRRAR
jgi:uncharacterized membrane protein